MTPTSSTNQHRSTSYAHVPTGAHRNPGTTSVREDAPDYRAASDRRHAALKMTNLLKAIVAEHNDVRLQTLDLLREVNRRSLYRQYGYEDFVTFCEADLGLGRQAALEHLRVAEALSSLPRIRHEFREGRLSWEQVRVMTTVATDASEGLWIDQARNLSFRRLRSEARDARRRGGGAPRGKE